MKQANKQHTYIISYHKININQYIHPYIHLFIIIYHYLSWSIYHYLSLSTIIYHYLSVNESINLSVYLSIYRVCVHVSAYVCVCACMCPLPQTITSMIDHFHHIDLSYLNVPFVKMALKWLELGWKSLQIPDIPSHVGAGKEAIHIHRALATKPVDGGPRWKPWTIGDPFGVRLDSGGSDFHPFSRCLSVSGWRLGDKAKRGLRKLLVSPTFVVNSRFLWKWLKSMPSWR